MGNGGLMQIGSAHEIYEKPNSLFVAQHLGQPGINSFEAELASEGDSYFAFAGEFKLPIAEEDGKTLMGKKISKCHLGIRPQYIQLGSSSENSETEIAYFGILEEYQNKKLGSFLLSEAIKKSFVDNTKRVWVHTCSLDHKNALSNYISRGMKIFKSEILNI